MSEPEQHFFESQRLRLAYWSWGDTSKPPLVLVHGGRDHSRNWDHVAHAFERDFHVIAPDLRGHGDSAWATGSEYPLAPNILDLARLIEIVGPPATVVGHSFGGQISMMTAGTFPELFTRLAVIEGTRSRIHDSPGGPSPASMRTFAEKARKFEGDRAFVYPDVESAARRMMEVNRRLPEDIAWHLALHATRAVEGGFIWKFDPWVRGRTPNEITPDQAYSFWANIMCPVLLVVGEESGGRSGQQNDVRYFRDARAVVVPKAGHWVHHEQLDAALETLRGFLVVDQTAEEAAGG